MQRFFISNDKTLCVLISDIINVSMNKTSNDKSSVVYRSRGSGCEDYFRTFHETSESAISEIERFATEANSCLI